MNMREAFEADTAEWSSNYNKRDADGSYSDKSVDCAWKTWQQTWQACLSHIGDGSKAEPEPMVETYTDEDGRIKVKWIKPPRDCGKLYPAPTEQDAEEGSTIYVRWRSVRVAPDDVMEWFEQCNRDDISDDGTPAFLVHVIRPAHTAQDSKVPEAWIELLQGIVNELSIMDDSQGVAGLHLNGEISSWDEGDLPYLRDRAASMLSAAYSISKKEGDSE